MKKNRFSLVISIMLVLGLALSLVSSGIASSADEQWSAAYPETVTVTIVNEEQANFVFPEGEDIYNNLWTKRWKDEYNVNVVTEWVSSDYFPKLNLSIAASELPDMFVCNNVQFQQLKDADLLADLTDIFREYGSPGYQKLMDDDPGIFNTAFKDDKLVGLPQLHYGYTCQPNYLWVRKDWMEAAGNPSIKTVEEFETFMKSMKEEHDAPYAISMDKRLTPFYCMAPGWHAYPRDADTRMWVDDGNGGIKSGYDMQGMKDALTTWAKWYADGLIRPDFASIEWEDMTPDIVGGTTGMECGPQWRGWQWFDIVKNYGEDSYLLCYDLPSFDGADVKYPISFLNTRYNVVSKDCKNPEVLVKLNSDYAYVLNEATVSGMMTSEEVLPFTSNNMHHTTGPFKVMFRSYDDTKDVISAVRTGEAKFTTGYALSYYDELMKWINTKEVSSLGRYVQMGHDRASLVMANGYEDRGLYNFTKTWGPQPQEELDNGTILDDIITEGVTKIIMGVEPVDYYDTVMAEWYAAGGEEVTQAVNAMYGSK